MAGCQRLLRANVLTEIALVPMPSPISCMIISALQLILQSVMCKPIGGSNSELA